VLGPDDLVFTAVPAAHVPLLERLAPVKAAGFAGICVGVEDYRSLLELGVSAKEIGARIADAGLEVADVECIGNWLPGHGEATGAYAAALAAMTPDRGIEIAAALGARGVLVVEMLGIPAPPLETAAECFARICDLAAGQGIIAHLEAVPFGGIATIRQARAIVEMAGRANGGLTVDSWHLFRGAGSRADISGLPGSMVGCVQLSDGPSVPQGDALRETTRSRLLPGEGQFDLCGLIAGLDAIGSTAPIAVEVFNRRHAGQPIEDMAREWAEAARATLAKARGGT